MKKFLSLVLALVMTMSLVTVGAGAADFTDDSSITYKEAVDVMTAIGVVGGYSDGSFGPKGTLTRGAAAKIICNLILGSTTANALVASAAPYSDVPADSTFAGYIAYLAKEGIVGGYADGTFRPTAPLTGYAFMKMLLGVIGLDADVEGYNEANWSIAVAKRALSETVDLTDGLVGDFDGTKTVTREEACLYAFNAINCAPFKYDTKSTIVVGGVTVSNTSEAKQDTDEDAKKYYEDVFKKLEAIEEPDPDDFGRPATQWEYDGDEIGTYAKSAKYTVVLGKNYKNDVDIEDELQDLVNNSKLKIDGDTDLFLNGEEMTTSAALTELGMVSQSKYATNGVTLELFCTKNHVDTVVAYFYKVAKIADVDDDVVKADKKDGVSCYVELKNGNTYNDNDIVGFDAKTYVKDAYVAYIEKSVDGKDVIISSFIVDEVEGSLSTVKDYDYATVDGTKYSFVMAAIDSNDVDALKTGSDNTYKLFLDKNGNVIGVETVKEDAAELDEVYYVTKIWSEKETKYGDSNDTYYYYAQLVDLAGNVKEVELEKLDKTKKSGTYVVNKADYEGKLVTISDKKWTNAGTTYKADNDKFDLTVWSNDDYRGQATGGFGGWKFTKSMTRHATKWGTLRFNSATKYVLIDGTNADVSATVKTGGIALTGDADMKGFFITEDDSNVVLYIVIYDATADIEENSDFDADNLVYIDSASSEKGDGYRIQEVYLADGKKAEWKVAESEYSLTEGKFYKYDTDDDGYYKLELASELNKGKVEDGVWDDEEGVIYGETFNSKGFLYEDLLTVSGVADIDVSKAAFVDLHDTDEGYAKTVKSLTALNNLFEKDGYTTSATLDLSVSEDGAVLIVVTALSHTKA